MKRNSCEKLHIVFKLAMMLAAVVFVMLISNTEKAKAAEYITNQKNGTIAVNYDCTTDKQTLVLVEHTDTYPTSNRYAYKLNKGKNNIVLPLTEGRGSYKIRIAEQKSGTSYAILYTTTIEYAKTDSEETYLVPSAQVDYKLTDKEVRKAKALRKKYKDDKEFYTAVYEYVIKNYSYDYDNLAEKTKSGSYYVPDIPVVYRSKQGICCDIACLAAAMLRSQGIQTQVIYGHSTKVKEYHAWNQIYNKEDDTWYILDMTYDMCKYKKGVIMEMYKNFDDYGDISYTY